MNREPLRPESSQHTDAAEMRERALIDELNHRVRNTLAIVQSIAVQTFRHDHTLAGARDAFMGRLMALSDAYEVLAAERWDGAGLEQVLVAAIGLREDADRRDRVSLAGPSVRLVPKAAMALTMATHELAANAARHGALSVASGRVAVEWSVAEHDGESRLTLTWAERGGPPVSPPESKGFGSRLIERGLPRELDGSARLDFRPDGVVCLVDAPLAAIEAGA